MAATYQLSKLLPFNLHQDIGASPACYQFDVSQYEDVRPEYYDKLREMLLLYMQQYYGLDCQLQLRIVPEGERTIFLIQFIKSNATLYHVVDTMKRSQFCLKSTGKFELQGLISMCENERTGTLEASRWLQQIIRNVEQSDSQLLEKLQISVSRALSLVQ